MEYLNLKISEYVTWERIICRSTSLTKDNSEKEILRRDMASTLVRSNTPNSGIFSTDARVHDWRGHQWALRGATYRSLSKFIASFRKCNVQKLHDTEVLTLLHYLTSCFSNKKVLLLYLFFYRECYCVFKIKDNTL